MEDLKMSTAISKIALGAWSWGAGTAGGDQVFGNHLFEEDLKPVFEKAMESGQIKAIGGNQMLDE
jgi:hypothetical protein